MQTQVSYADLYDRQASVWSRLLDGSRSLKRITYLSQQLEGVAEKSVKQLHGVPKQMDSAGKTIDGFTVAQVLQDCTQASTALGTAFSSFCDGLNAHVHTPLSDSKSTIRKTGDRLKSQAAKLQAEIAKLKRTYNDNQARAKRAADALERARQDAEQLEHMQPPPDQSKRNAAQKKIASAQRAFADADKAHRAAVEACAQRQVSGAYETTGLLEEAAGADAQRIAALQQGIAALAAQIGNFGDALTSIGAELQRAAESVDVQKDMAGFVELATVDAGDNEAEPRVRYVKVTPGDGTPVPAASQEASSSAAPSTAGLETRTVLYDYVANDEGCVSCTSGQTVTVLQPGPDWTMVRVGGLEGLVPTSYLSTPEGTAPKPTATESQLMEVIYDFSPDDTSAGQMTVNAGEIVRIVEVIDGGWVQAEVKDHPERQGLVPQSYLKSI